MNSKAIDRRPVIIFGAIWVLFLLTRFVGSRLFENNWSMTGFDYLPAFTIGAAVLIPMLIWAMLWQAEKSSWSQRSTHIIAGVLAGLTFTLCLDSFVYAGGNLRVAGLAQTPTVIYRAYEYGSIAIADGLYRLWSVFDLPNNQAGVYSWRTFSWISAALSFWGVWLISGRLTNTGAKRLALLVLMWFGPQLLVLLGYVGVESTIAVTTVWFALQMIKLGEKSTTRRILWLWLIFIVGCLLHAGNLYLLPAAVFATGSSASRSGKKLFLPIVSAIVVLIGMTAGIFIASGSWFGLTRHLLFLKGKAPFGDYGLFSMRHMGDIFAFFWMLLPGLGAAKIVSLFGDRRALTHDHTVVGLVLMCVAGGIVVSVTDPFNSIVLDLPRLAAFLTPFPIFCAVVLARIDRKQAMSRLLLPTAAALSVAAIACTLPTYLKIANVDPVAATYFDHHDWYHRDGSLAFRDAYFYRGEMDRANRWDQGILSNSPDRLDLTGINDLVVSDRVPEAITRLYAIKTRNRYWIEARSILAGLQMQAGRSDRAWPEIDTMMMIDPYRRESLMNLYIYHRETGANAPAMKTIEQALSIFPGDSEILTDKMLLYHRIGNYQSADSMAVALMASDDAMPYPYLVRGMYEDSRGNQTGAIGLYEEFLRLAPNAPEESRIRQRLTQLRSGAGN